MKKVLVLSAIFLAGVLAAGRVQAAEATYIGVKKCKMCHKKQHTTWAKTKHANNFALLQGDETTNPDCIKCHTTGYNPKDNSYVDKNTTCEACHGPGSLHMKAKKADKKKTIKRIPDGCVRCHNPHVDIKAMVEAHRAK
jgi:hypothetical protein